MKSTPFNFPIICVGNIAVGGTGKTPMTELIVALLKDECRIAILSRGYKRRTKGFAIANQDTTALEIGDEPMQFHTKFPDVLVAVGEERLVAIPQILFQHPTTDVIVLDDAFQHRNVKAGINVILTEYNNLYSRDFMFPVGDLRDVRSSMRRAEIIVVTKCNHDLSAVKASAVKEELQILPHQKIFYTTIDYGNPYHLFQKNEIKIHFDLDVLLLCGIANPAPLKEFLHHQTRYFEMIKYNDHHIFSTSDLAEIIKQFEQIKSENKVMITTEKDAVRLLKYQSELSDFPIYVLPIKHRFLFDQENEFKEILRLFVKDFSK